MATKYHTLGAIQIPRGMVWVDEFAWQPVEKSAEYSITGALLIDSGVRLAGRTITLQADTDAGWITRATLLALQALAVTPEGVHTLTLADARTFTVQFAPGECITATPIARPELPSSSHPYVATLRLIEV
jgi:hypothetical protein